MERNSSKIKIFLIFVLLLLVALGGVYYYIAADSDISLEDISEKIESNLLQQEKIEKSELDSKDTQIQRLKAQTKALKKEQESTPVKLRYSIKPKDKIVARCVNMKIGRWGMPKNCTEELTSGIVAMARADNKIVAFEISGVVDNLPYAGLSPELKQEGLASFRAREAIYIVSKRMPNVAAFEGLSQQKANQRGFVVRAYYVE
ncbi:hypothetical protein LS66_000180 [Helicobacter sp. MIT 03-1614]|jgi:hypothetical protein|uniref:Uncharacterized protein n=1 Tax=Helicobacter hepaticus (strain ATCC 51449 / 3B1) TaxID=235279 RepID=Q7VGM4_HELHP|nr:MULTISPECIES: hypothetical protein [Helicobacter]AAP77894.1 hypothetical protein HH_1297 [Helicobacter hepaticus ATCC 51449]TLD90790.1 hypothetical protein LS66_000180 [Helicobacter sp. MIT 03-1614]